MDVNIVNVQRFCVLGSKVSAFAGLPPSQCYGAGTRRDRQGSAAYAEATLRQGVQMLTENLIYAQ